MAGQQVVDGNWRNVGYQQLTSIDTSTALTVPAGARVAVITPETQAVRIRSDGTAPTASVGTPLAALTPFFFNGDLSGLRVISQVAGAKLNVMYLGD